MKVIFILSLRVWHSEGKTLIFQRGTSAAPAILFLLPDLRHYKRSLPDISVSRVLSLTKTLFFSPLLLMLRLSLPPSLSVCLQGTRDKNHQCGWRKCRGCEETAGRGGCLQGWLDELKGEEVGQTLSSALSSTDNFFAALLEISCFSTESGTVPAVIRGSIWSFATEKQCQHYANKAVFVLLWTSFETPAGSAKVRDCFWLWTLLIERSG